MGEVTLEWRSLETLYEWERQNFPRSIDVRHAKALLIWLLKHYPQPQSIGDLYRDVQVVSEPTMREVVRSFIEGGLLEIEVGDEDGRRRRIKATDKLIELAQQYAELVRRLALDEGAPEAQR